MNEKATMGQSQARTVHDVPWVVVDVETTGTSPRNNRIIEIACVRVENGEIVDSFSSLIKPGQHISSIITGITGISNAMVFNAPESTEVMPKVREMLTDGNPIFVAHNAEFDWKFVQEELHRCGLKYIHNKKLCTYKLARRLLTKNKKFNLGHLSRSFGIQMRNRHRALGDAQATAEVLLHFFTMIPDEDDAPLLETVLALQHQPLKKFKNVPKHIQALAPVLDELPNTPGVYKYYSLQGELLYIGKAKSLRKRVRSYFQTGVNHEKKVRELVSAVRKIETIETESELSALLLESRLIKEHRPRFNTLIKRYRSYPFLRINRKDDFAYIDYTFEIEDDGAEYYGPFRNRYSVELIIEIINAHFLLRTCDIAIHEGKQDHVPCFYYQIKKCKAPCAGLQSAQEYEEEIQRVRGFLSGEDDGIVKFFKERMDYHADLHEYELAQQYKLYIEELRKILYRQKQIASSVNNNNVIVAIPGASEDTTELFMIRHGRLCWQTSFDRNIPSNAIFAHVESVFFTSEAAPEHCTKVEIDEMRIIASWLNSNKLVGWRLYIDKLSIEQVQQQLLAKLTDSLLGM